MAFARQFSKSCLWSSPWRRRSCSASVLRGVLDKTMTLLEIKNLHASVNGNEILKGIDLTVNPGEVHSIMGPNGSGKSTLAQVLARRESYEVTGGSITFNGKDLLEMKPEEAASEGLFMAFQYPVEIPGISNAYFLRAALNAIGKYRGQDELDAMDFLPLLKERMRMLEMDERFLNRPVNEGFSGGEKKRNEIVQMGVLEPRLAVLDETDSGLDIDALKIVAKGVNAMRSKDRAMVLVTHYQRLLDYIVPDFVHVLVNGRIVKSGGPELALELEQKGYSWTEGELAGARRGVPQPRFRKNIWKHLTRQRSARPPSLVGCALCARKHSRASPRSGSRQHMMKTGASPAWLPSREHRSNLLNLPGRPGDSLSRLGLRNLPVSWFLSTACTSRSSPGCHQRPRAQRSAGGRGDWRMMQPASNSILAGI